MEYKKKKGINYDPFVINFVFLSGSYLMVQRSSPWRAQKFMKEVRSHNIDHHISKDKLHK